MQDVCSQKALLYSILSGQRMGLEQNGVCDRMKRKQGSRRIGAWSDKSEGEEGDCFGAGGRGRGMMWEETE